MTFIRVDNGIKSYVFNDVRFKALQGRINGLEQDASVPRGFFPQFENKFQIVFPRNNYQKFFEPIPCLSFVKISIRRDLQKPIYFIAKYEGFAVTDFGDNFAQANFVISKSEIQDFWNLFGEQIRIIHNPLFQIARTISHERERFFDCRD